jgi:SAM-dependent methyltransferase
LYKVSQIIECEVCGNTNLRKVLDLGFHPLCGDLIKVGEKNVCEEYPIEILFCPTCITAHQKYQLPKEILFHYDYQYRARMTPSVLSGMKALVETLNDQMDSLAGKKVLDIGCNDGSLLDYFSDKGATTVGVEPTCAALDSKHRTLNNFFDNETTQALSKEFGSFDVITFTNVFAHIEDLNGLLKNLKVLLDDNSVLIIENHYMGEILNKHQFDTFYHEHPRTYSLKSFKFIAKKLGRNVSNYEFISRYGGNIRVTISKKSSVTMLAKEASFEEGFNLMHNDMIIWRDKMKMEIINLNKRFGPIVAKAFPGRAAILIKILGLTEEHLSCVYEITGSKKTGFYVPGTRIPIKPEKELFDLKNKPEYILNLAWHIPKEVRDNLQKNGITSKVVDIKT